MIWLMALSFIILLTYVGIMIKRHGIPYSVSDTYYSLEHKWSFTITMMSSALLLAPSAFSYSDSNTEFLVFLFTFGQLLVGVAPHFRTYQKAEHIAGAVLLLVGSQIWIGFNVPLVLCSWIIYLIATLMAVVVKNEKFIAAFLHTKPLFWVEVVAFLNLYFCLTVKMFRL